MNPCPMTIPATHFFEEDASRLSPCINNIIGITYLEKGKTSRLEP